MRFVMQLDGVVFDVAGACHSAHRLAAADVGWSSLDRSTFWRLLRKQGHGANFLPGARPAKIADYQVRFTVRMETDEVIAQLRPFEGMPSILCDLTRRGPVLGVTRGENLPRRESRVAECKLRDHFQELHALDPDPRRRPGQLRALTHGDERTLLIAATDALIRAGGSAELFTVGIPTGDCFEDRLHRAGADVVYRRLGELGGSLASGGHDLIRAGLLPLSRDA